MLDVRTLAFRSTLASGEPACPNVLKHLHFPTCKCKQASYKKGSIYASSTKRYTLRRSASSSCKKWRTSIKTKLAYNGLFWMVLRKCRSAGHQESLCQQDVCPACLLCMLPPGVQLRIIEEELPRQRGSTGESVGHACPQAQCPLLSTVREDLLVSTSVFDLPVSRSLDTSTGFISSTRTRRLFVHNKEASAVMSLRAIQRQT